jgi:hypothetical protein
MVVFGMGARSIAVSPPLINNIGLIKSTGIKKEIIQYQKHYVLKTGLSFVFGNMTLKAINSNVRQIK